MTNSDLQKVLDNVRGAIMIAYPMGLPEWDTVRDILEDKEDLSGSAVLYSEIINLYLNKSNRPQKKLCLWMTRPSGGLERNCFVTSCSLIMSEKMRKLKSLLRYRE